MLHKRRNRSQQEKAALFRSAFLWMLVACAVCSIPILAVVSVGGSVSISALVLGDEVQPPGGGGGGGGASVAAPAAHASTTLMGRAYPGSTVTILRDGAIVVETVAGFDAKFQVTLTELTPGSYNFSVYTTDSSGRRSATISYPMLLTSGAIAQVSGIFIAPTIDLSARALARGDTLTMFGQTVPDATVSIVIHSDSEHFLSSRADAHGAYVYNFDTSPLASGQHEARSKASSDGEVSPYGLSATFAVAGKGESMAVPSTTFRGDLNNDGRINLIDFSIAAYWYKQPLSDAMKTIERERLNGDGVVNLVDFSIMAYYWTG
ncbi:MAG: Ig-like domain-containing protein [Candidatus Uhrbacteria bacterium]